MAIIQIKQADGAIRIIAVSAQDAAAVRNDRAMIDGVRALGAVEVYRDGREFWGCTGPAYKDIPKDIRDELKYAAKQ